MADEEENLEMPEWDWFDLLPKEEQKKAYDEFFKNLPKRPENDNDSEDSNT